MGVARHMGWNSKTIADAVSPRPREDKAILRRERAPLYHITPVEPCRSLLARSVNRIDDAETLRVKPMRPFLGIVVNA